MPLRFVTPPSFYPPASLLGRLAGRWAQDRRQAESFYFVAAALVLCVGSLLSQWGWVAFGAIGPGGTPEPWYFAVQIVGGLLLGGVCLLGWKPAVTVEAHEGGLDVRQGTEALSLPYARIHAAERISADAYHRHWRRYAATRAFVNRLPAELLLLRTASGPLVLGLAPEDLDRLEAHLAVRTEVQTSAPLVRAA
ncbi:MAG: hypothetical protein ABJF88_12370 [Rhodothermales bacterium]